MSYIRLFNIRKNMRNRSLYQALGRLLDRIFFVRLLLLSGFLFRFLPGGRLRLLFLNDSFLHRTFFFRALFLKLCKRFRKRSFGHFLCLLLKLLLFGLFQRFDI